MGADYIRIDEVKGPHRLKLLFPFAMSIGVKKGVVKSGSQILAQFPNPENIEIHQARYNLLTQETQTLNYVASWAGQPPPEPLSGLDPAFSGGRTALLNRWIEYQFPAVIGEPIYVYLGIISRHKVNPGEMLLKLSVDEVSQIVDVADASRYNPILSEFAVRPQRKVIRVKSECDCSSANPSRPSLINGIWIFTQSTDKEDIKSGKASGRALFYVRCGEETPADTACAVELAYGERSADEPIWVRLPYKLDVCEAGTLASVSLEQAETATENYWKTLLDRGARLHTGIRRLDNLYQTSLINLFLLRTKYPGAGQKAEDLYVAKPGATIYDDFWYRDASYIIAALDIAGYPEQAEQCLRLFWQKGLSGIFKAWGQQAAGSWQVPITEWDCQGQALWSLVNHFQVTGDTEWLRKIYGAIRRGALWLNQVTQETQVVTEHGEKPITFGLLPRGKEEGSLGVGLYIYYHDFWTVLGLRQALAAAEILGERDDAGWIKRTLMEFTSNLLASVKLAYARVGDNQFIPATPFDPKLPIWGSAAALYPTRFLARDDRMISSTLERLASDCREDEYAFSTKPNKIWTYITADLAMCHLLRNELSVFYRLFNGYVAHASPTNAWIEEIFLDSRLGTGDMPHGWAAAQFVHLLRNCLVYEDGNSLELCWGVQPDWLTDGAQIEAKDAPTQYGRIQFALRRAGSELVLDYERKHNKDQAIPEAVHFHVPPSLQGITALCVNGQVQPVSSGQSVLLAVG
jgi:hypothetical protein